MWLARAADLEPYAAPAAEAFRAAAAELDSALQAAEDELLTPSEAARVSGLSKRRLRELRAAGKLCDHGRSGRPRYRRGDLPVRRQSVDVPAGGYDVEGDVAALTARMASRPPAPPAGP